jgi:glycosyltransferase involved in cell wall biosynthesis
MSFPLVTCLCNTRNRPELLSRCVNYFKGQTYPNKELLIVYEEDDIGTNSFLERLHEPTVRSLKVPITPKRSLGALRNEGILESKGEIICIWDDDDWYHSRRIEIQVSHLLASHKAVCLMAHIFLYDSYNAQAYLGHLRMWEGSMVCYKYILSEDRFYGDMNRSEDKFLVDKLKMNHMVFPLIMPQLYIYIIHGNNTWSNEHFAGMFRCSQKLSDESSQLIKSITEHSYRQEEASEIIDSAAVLAQLKYQI